MGVSFLISHQKKQPMRMVAVQPQGSGDPRPEGPRPLPSLDKQITTYTYLQTTDRSVEHRVDHQQKKKVPANRFDMRNFLSVPFAFPGARWGTKMPDILQLLCAYQPPLLLVLPPSTPTFIRWGRCYAIPTIYIPGGSARWCPQHNVPWALCLLMLIVLHTLLFVF